MPINTQSEIAEYKNEKNQKIPLMQELRDEEIILEDMGISREDYKGRTVGIISRTNDPSLNLKPLFAHRLKRVQDKFGEDSNFTNLFNEFNEDELNFVYLLGVYYKNQKEKYDALENAYKIFEELEIDIVVLDNVELDEYCYETPSIEENIDINFKVSAMLGSNILEEKYFTKKINPLNPNQKEMEGVGTEDSPFVVTEFEHLKMIGSKKYPLNRHYILGNDIDALQSKKERWAPIGDFFPKKIDSKEIVKNSFKINEINPKLIDENTNSKEEKEFIFELSHQTKKQYGDFKVFIDNDEISETNFLLSQQEEKSTVAIKGVYYNEDENIISVEYLTYEQPDYTNSRLEIKTKPLCQALLSDNSQCKQFAQIPKENPKYCGVHYPSLNKDYANKGFRGVFDGNGHKIKNMFIIFSRRRKSGFSGIFALNNGVIKNLKIEKCVTIGPSNLSIVAGINNGEIKNCSITNSIISSNVGTSGGVSVVNNGEIKNCKSHCKIESHKNLGGIASINKSPGLIKSSYSTSSIKGQNSGILVSTNEGKIQNSYVAGKINNNSYSENGLFCYKNNNIIKNCYSKEASQNSLDFYYKNDGELKESSVKDLESLTDVGSYNKWDFDNIWNISDQQPPYLMWENKKFKKINKESNDNKLKTIHKLTSKNIENYFKNNYATKNKSLTIDNVNVFKSRSNKHENIEFSNDKITIKNHKREGIYQIEKIYASDLHKKDEDNLIRSFYLDIKGDYFPSSIEKTIEVKYTTNRLNHYHKIPINKITNMEQIDISSAKYIEFKIKLINYDNINRPPIIEKISFNFNIQTKADVRYSINGSNKYVSLYTSPKGNYPIKANINLDLYRKDNRYKKYFIKQLAQYCKENNSIGLVKAPSINNNESKNNYYSRLLSSINEVKDNLKDNGNDLGRYVGVVLGEAEFYDNNRQSSYTNNVLTSSSLLFQKYNVENSPTNKNIENIQTLLNPDRFTKQEIKNLTNAGYTIIYQSRRNGVVPYRFKSLEEDFDLYKNINTRRVVNYIAKKIEEVTYEYIGKGSSYPFEREISNDIEDVMEEEKGSTIQDYNFQFEEIEKESIKLSLQLQIIGEVEAIEVTIEN